MEKYKKFISREKAGETLAELIYELGLKAPWLFAIPRGGVQTAIASSSKLNLPINALVVKKLPAPENPEYGFGAVTEDGTKVLNRHAVDSLGLSDEIIEKIALKVISEIEHRKEVFGGLDDEKIKISDVIIIDDGVATGYSLIAAIETVKKRGPKSITVAVPVCSKTAYSKIKGMVNYFICPIISDDYFFAVANYYEEWYDLSEAEIVSILKDSL